MDAFPSVMDAFVAFVADGEAEDQDLVDAFPAAELPSELVSLTAMHVDLDHWSAVSPFPMIPAYQVVQASGTVGKHLDQDSFLHPECLLFHIRDGLWDSMAEIKSQSLREFLMQ